MRILLTNDDGVHAKGLTVLEELARSLSDDVWIVAPETDQSGLSHSLTLSHPLRARKVRDQCWAVNGTPTDCVIMAKRQLIEGNIDLVLSGVNAGQNVGDHVTYSGTIAGAMEGTLLGIRSIALSQSFRYEISRTIPWDTARTLGPDLLKKLIALDLPADTLLNVNFPPCPADEADGEMITSQGKFGHGLGIDERTDSRGIAYYWLKFMGKLPDHQPGSDIAALASNNTSITPIRLDLTDHATLERLSAEWTKGS